ncbi:MAG: hypothetical protein D6737_16010 [Chloroflexi bacterium]|nr:MAG: hypothetical protein CUN54_08365 [Phototrophicales bacterium]RMF78053.1 MAG: hypothetical protein D6737_16010 [Chloroflexota bacterium]
MLDKVTVYAHPACPMVYPVLEMLKRSQVEYEYINIHEDYQARAKVREINHGDESVPTLVFADGTTLTEPTSGQLEAKLIALGYHVPLIARITSRLPQIILLAIILFAVLRFVEVI